jgi:hypothetical protein
LGDNIDMLNDVKSGDVLSIYEETDWYKWWPE